MNNRKKVFITRMQNSFSIPSLEITEFSNNEILLTRDVVTTNNTSSNKLVLSETEFRTEHLNDYYNDIVSITCIVSAYLKTESNNTVYLELIDSDLNILETLQITNSVNNDFELIESSLEFLLLENTLYYFRLYSSDSMFDVSSREIQVNLFFNV